MTQSAPVAIVPAGDPMTLVNEKDLVSITTNKNGVVVAAALNTNALNRIVQRFAAQKSDDDAADSVTRERQSTE
jgi:hypothetical protein